MRIDLLFPVLPPALDGIGDHTAHLAAALAAEGGAVRVLTAQARWTAIPGVEVVQAFRCPPRRGVGELVRCVAMDPPDWFIVQFNQFSYGRWGLNPFLPITLRKLRRRWPRMRLAVLFHEDFVPPTSWRNRVFRCWQIPQFRALGRLADVVAFSIQPWVAQYRSWFPQARVVHWPVGSNIPDVGCDRSKAREQLGIAPEGLVVGVFGTIGAGRLVDYIAAAIDRLWREGLSFEVLYVGPHGKQLRAHLPSEVVLRDAGVLSDVDASIHLAAMDLLLAPFVDGASTRRGSMIVGLQHGLAVLSTDGPLTDPLLRAEHGRSLWLTPVADRQAFAEAAWHLATHPALRQKLGHNARRFYGTELDWMVLAQRVRQTLVQVKSDEAVRML
ncbi:glycosyltransferase [Rhodothermus profundi]|uniref:Glycosyltransferase involved in cell wall bisynthesis n=1 Tax=Rhodothermus profundi TaxID=633813 RepID=A0A1M6XJQ1_9BACT|nr:glycosyltransferase [Rhodothermus profundi]SHL06214.1 Glycosyltransferase involved in cell wall bisynthesis [Rhodothermus profundi]